MLNDHRIENISVLKVMVTNNTTNCGGATSNQGYSQGIKVRHAKYELQEREEQ